MRVGGSIALMALAFVAPVAAQNQRERAVAANQVALQPTDRFGVERVAGPFAYPWSLAFLPDGRMLVSEKRGGLRIVEKDGSVGSPLDGSPANVLAESDSGLLDVALDPDFAANGLVYVAFAEGTVAANRTAVWRGRLEGERLTGGKVIFRVSTEKADSAHPGGRLLFLPDKTFLLSVGDGYGYRDEAQAPGSHLGKVLRLTREGSAPADNPFVGREGYLPEIWTLGHRNIQGLLRDPATGDIWASEHGPRGGDEINRLVAGSNYGWPRASLGIDYDGSLITPFQHVEGMARPAFAWSPSIGPSGLALYTGDRHPNLKGRLLSGSLSFRHVIQLGRHPDSGDLVEENRLLTGLRERIRDVREGPDGHLYLLTDRADGALLRVLAADAPGGA